MSDQDKKVEYGIEQNVGKRWVGFAVRCLIQSDADALRVARQFGDPSQYRAVRYVTTVEVIDPAVH